MMRWEYFTSGTKIEFLAWLKEHDDIPDNAKWDGESFEWEVEGPEPAPRKNHNSFPWIKDIYEEQVRQSLTSTSLMLGGLPVSTSPLLRENEFVILPIKKMEEK